MVRGDEGESFCFDVESVGGREVWKEGGAGETEDKVGFADG